MKGVAGVFMAIGVFVVLFIVLGLFPTETPEMQARREKLEAIDALCARHLADQFTCDQARSRVRADMANPPEMHK